MERRKNKNKRLLIDWKVSKRIKNKNKKKRNKKKNIRNKNKDNINIRNNNKNNRSNKRNNLKKISLMNSTRWESKK